MKRNKSLGWIAGAMAVAMLFAGCKKDDSASIPTVSTSSITNLKMNGATCGGTIQDDGGAPITERGLCWSSSAQGTVTDSTTKVGSGTGSFTCSFASLQPSTTYHVRAYATNSLGTSYGAVVSFTTIDCPNQIRVGSIRIVSNSSILCKYEQLSSSGAPLTERGLCWSTSENPTVEGGTAKVLGAADDLSAISINGLANNTTYHIRAYAKNAGGIGYGKDTTFTTYNWEIGSVTDIDNNTYKTIKIGNQVWMQENLRVTHYRNGDPIPNLSNDNEWKSATAGAYCWPYYDKAKYEKNGALYNGYTVADLRNVCPVGWHIPSMDEVKTLLNFCGGVSGKKMTDVYFEDGVICNTNETGFYGYYSYSRFERFMRWPKYWTSDKTDYDFIYFELDCNFVYTGHTYGNGNSIRCIKD